MKRLEEIIQVMLLPELSPRSRQEVERVVGDLQGLRRSYRKLRPRLRRQREEAAALCTELLSHPAQERVRRIRLTRHRLRSRPLVEELLRRSVVAGYEAPEEARHLADLASQVTLALFGSEELAGGARGLNDLQALVLAHQGNALRRQGDRSAAGDCFGRALRFLGLGSGSGRVAAQLGLLHGQYLRDVRRWAEAERTLSAARETFERRADEAAQGRALLLLASVYSGREEEAAVLPALLEACVLVDEDHDPHVALACWNQLAAAYAEDGQGEAAEDLLEDALAILGERPTGSGAAARRCWAVGRAHAAADRWQAAEAALRSAWEAFLGRGLRTESALVGLELGAALARLAKPRELAAVAEETCRRVAGVPLGRDLSSALGRFVESCRESLPLEELYGQLRGASRRCRYLGDWGG